MSEEAPQEGATAPAEEKPDQFTNLKAEFSRKFESVNSQLAAQNQQMQQQLNAILATMTTKQTEQAGGQEKLSDMIYNNPEKAADLIAENASRKAAATINGYQERQGALTALAQQYPELNDVNSELSKRAIETYNSLPANLRDTAAGYKMAIRDAAADLGVLVASKRQKATESNDDFTVGGNSTARKSPPKSKDAELSQDTLDIAKLMGLDTEDPKVVANLKLRAKRTNYKKYE